MSIRSIKQDIGLTGKLPSLVRDYLADKVELRSLHQGLPSVESVRAAMDRRASFAVDRTRLVSAIRDQYSSVKCPERTLRQIEALGSESTFTITTAHQCNIFLGPLYTIYKTLHAIRIADELNLRFPQNHFVPVFYIGSEDADLQELNHIWLMGERFEWSTDQRGAVGRMHVDEALLHLIDLQAQQLSSLPHGAHWVEKIRRAYQKGATIADSCFHLLHDLFAARGLIVLQPDRHSLKTIMKEVFWKELTRSYSAAELLKTDQSLRSLGYSSQVQGRPVNLFYLAGASRERIERVNDRWMLTDGSKEWNESELRAELDLYPDRFSPNVILRGVYQESILPNLIYVGGGAEIAYWLQLKSVFDASQVPFPLLQLRASFQWVDHLSDKRMQGLELDPSDLFKNADQILAGKMSQDVRQRLDLGEAVSKITEQYTSLLEKSRSIDPTLQAHVESLRVKALKKIEELGKKMERAERRKMSVEKAQIESLQQTFFPGQVWQERRDNVGYYFALYGERSFEWIYQETDPFGGKFNWLIETV